jgi:hypothetical protein
LETVRTVVESFIRLVKAEIDPEAVLVAADDVFEVPKVPSLILQGPTLIENGERRTQARMVEKDVPHLSYEECRYPRLYHLDFDVIVTAAHEGELLDLQEKVARFYQRFAATAELVADDILDAVARRRALLVTPAYAGVQRQ